METLTKQDFSSNSAWNNYQMIEKVRQFLKEKGILKDGYSKWIVRFSDDSTADIVELIAEFAKLQKNN